MENYFITVDGEELIIERDASNALDLIKVDTDNFHVLQNNQAYDVELVDTDFLNKTMKVLVNGNAYTLKIEDSYDQIVKKMGLLANTAQKLNNIKAPMPGLIIDIMVEAGQEITEGTPLIVLSAMKMENIILAQGDGVIKSIEVKKDDAVEKGQIIIEIE